MKVYRHLSYNGYIFEVVLHLGNCNVSRIRFGFVNNFSSVIIPLPNKFGISHKCIKVC